jgi:Tol biopolymer transport system component
VLFDIARETTTRFTLESGYNTNPVWSRDGSRIIYSSTRQGNRLLIQRPANGIGAETTLKMLPTTRLTAGGVSPDGQRFLINQPAAETGDAPITLIVNWPKLLQK